LVDFLYFFSFLNNCLVTDWEEEDIVNDLVEKL
jgi:hypothetical protein